MSEEARTEAKRTVRGRAQAGVVLAAAGRGERFGGPKQLLEIGGRPLLEYSLEAFAGAGCVAALVVTAPAADPGPVRRVVEGWVRGRRPSFAVNVVPGGESRQDSVRRGLEALRGKVEWVLVHDAARPLIRPVEIREVFEAVLRYGAAAIGHPASDSLKEEEAGFVRRGVDRASIWQVQTPQGGRLEDLLRAYEALPEGRLCTDEAALLETIGIAVRLVPGPRDNVKVTSQGDEVLAECLLARRRGAGS